jgi:hypothetical protein
MTGFPARSNGAASCIDAGCTIARMKVTAVLAMLLPLCAAAESFRCGKWIIDADTSLTELRSKCGEPTSRTSRSEDVRAPNQYTGGNTKVGETLIETWTYARGSQAPPMVVTIVDGRIKTIERGK